MRGEIFAPTGSTRFNFFFSPRTLIWISSLRLFCERTFARPFAVWNFCLMNQRYGSAALVKEVPHFNVQSWASCSALKLSTHLSSIFLVQFRSFKRTLSYFGRTEVHVSYWKSEFMFSLERRLVHSFKSFPGACIIQFTTSYLRCRTELSRFLWMPSTDVSFDPYNDVNMTS